MVAVVKADGYGHGAVPLARMFESMDEVWGYAVATIEEGIQLRLKGMKKPILLLGGIFPDQYEQLIKNEIRMNIFSREMAEDVAVCAARLGKKAYGHIKIDTGMSRLGFFATDEGVEEICAIDKDEYLELEGIFTHFARADETDKTFTDQQMERFAWMIDRLHENGIDFPYHHCANSAGIIESRGTTRELVRAGISIYGLYPSEEVEMDVVKLQPALSLTASVSSVKWLPAGTPVSYGGTFVTEKDTRIATIPVGYGDGYPRSLSNRGYVLLHGKKAPILGRVCMDQFMVDVTDIPDVNFGDRATLIGRDGEEMLPVETLSELSGRFNYEFVCDLGKRIPREYVSGGNVVEQIDYFS
jgi:alanine racemase